MFNIRKDYLILIGGMSLWGGLLFAVFIYLSNMFTATQAPTQGEWQQDDPRLLPQPSVVIEIPVEVPVTVSPTAFPEDEMLARISSYWPGSLGPNCHPENIVDGECTTWLTDGVEWRHWSWWATNRNATACPKEFPLGTLFDLGAAKLGTSNDASLGTYVCIDRGGAIKFITENGETTFFLDLLSPNIPFVPGARIIKDKYSPSGHYVVPVTVTLP